MSRLLYSLAWWFATPLVMVYLLWRARKQPAYLRHWRERWAWVPRRRRRGRPLIWVHAVSVGETRAAEPLIRALQLRYPQAEWLVTNMTPTGREAAAQLYGDSVRQAYLPYDYALAMRRFLKAWRPSFGIVMETELWPNLTAQANRLRIPIAAVNVRLSEKSLRKGLRFPTLIGDALQRLDTVAAQTPGDAERLAQLGRRDIIITGNMKFDVTPSAAGLELGRQWQQALAGRPVLLAASTREGEEVLLLAAWKKHLAARPNPDRSAPLLVIVPRHPQRFDDVMREIEQGGWRVGRRSALVSEGAPDGRFRSAGPSTETGLVDPGLVEAFKDLDVWLGDSMGEMTAYYAMADLALIGGSFLRFGGQNLIEACALGVPVVLGPHTYNFALAAEQAVEAGAGWRVVDLDQAVAGAWELLADPPHQQSMSNLALSFANSHRGATQRTIEALEPLLERCRGRLVPEAAADSPVEPIVEDGAPGLVDQRPDPVSAPGGGGA